MNGAESLMRSFAAGGVEICFANPGTTEMDLVAALDGAPGLRGVLGLFEGVCTGAADGYARMARRPALTLLHLGPGFANGIANLHNARRARSPVVNLVGDHARWHRAADAPLTTDIVSLARPVSDWVETVEDPKLMGQAAAQALCAALEPPGQVATLILPQDCAWEEAPGPTPPLESTPRRRVEEAAVGGAARALRSRPALILLGGDALSERALELAARVAGAAGCDVACETFVARVERGGGLPAFGQLPYFPEQARQLLEKYSNLVLVASREPVAFFGYRGGSSSLVADACTVTTLAEPGWDAEAALEALAERLGASRRDARAPAPGSHSAAGAEVPTPPPDGRLGVGSLGRAVAALIPEQAIVVNEATTSGLAFAGLSGASRRHTTLQLTGGAIGQGLPCAVGAALACPERRVIALEADGSGMYTPQALWTLAREGLDVTVIVCANRAYRILQVELARAGVAEPGPAARALTDLSHPDLDWVSLARGLGVTGVRVDTAEGLGEALARSLATPGPTLIEAVLEDRPASPASR
ncbi:MAG: acetolactate synthase large subunit [Myxococcota bacterium]